MKLYLGALVFAAATAWAQSTPFQCAASVAAPPTVRAEGVTELTGDLVLTCTGGTPTPKGQAVPSVKISATFNTSVTSRQFPSGSSDALLLIDEPAGPANPLIPQVACPSLSGCAMAGTGGAANEYNGSTAPNVFVGIQRGPNTLIWLGVPLDPPGSTTSRIVRLTNLRANANQIAVGNNSSSPISVSVAISGASNIPLSNATQTVATIAPGLTVGTTPAQSLQCSSPASFNLTLTEKFPGAFKQQNSGTTQNVPGQSHLYAESGFIPPDSVGLPSGAGTVGTPTVFQITVSNLTPGMTLQVPSTIPVLASGTPAGSASTVTVGGTASGSNVLFVVPQGATSILFLVQVLQVTSGTPIKTLTVPMTLSWSTATVPGAIVATASFLLSPYPQADLFVPGTTFYPAYPIWQTLDSGIQVPPSPGLTVANIVNCNSTVSLLTPASIAPATFAGYANLVAPAHFNYGLVSTGPPISGITVTKDPTATWLSVSLNQTVTPATATLTVTPLATAGSYSTTLVFNSPSGSLSVPVVYTVATGPLFIRYGFGNVSSYVNDVVAPGEVFVLFGANGFGPSQLAGLTEGSDGHVVTLLAGTQVLFDGQAAPLYYTVDSNGIGQIAGFAPFELDGKTQTSVQVISNGVSSPPVVIPVLPSVPGLSTSDESGGGPGAILNQDQSVNGPNNPDSVGNIITLFGTGAGQTSPAGRDGAFAGVGAPLAVLNQPVKVFIDGILATNVPYAGPAPQEVEGVLQVDVQIPSTVHHPGDLSVVVWVGNQMTQPGVTVSVK